jgi:hypothetical protein
VYHLSNHNGHIGAISHLQAIVAQHISAMLQAGWSFFPFCKMAMVASSSSGKT